MTYENKGNDRPPKRTSTPARLRFLFIKFLGVFYCFFVRAHSGEGVFGLLFIASCFLKLYRSLGDLGVIR